MKKFLSALTLLAIFGSTAWAMSSPPPSAAKKAEQANVAAQMDVKARATSAVPVPHTTNFQARKNLAEFMRRTDEPGKVWYVYERSRGTGEILGFYTSSSYPQSVCTFMTPPEEIKLSPVMDKSGGYGQDSHVTKAMALDGVYYSGGDCPDFFFDYVTGAVVVLDTDAIANATDRLLDMDVPNFTFKEDVENQ